MKVPHGLCTICLAVALLCSAHDAHAAWRRSLIPIGAHSAPLTLADAGKTGYLIVIPAQPTTQEQKAADDLAHWLGEMTGAEFPIVPDTAPAIPTEISVGRTSRLRGADARQAAADLGDEGYGIAVRDSKLLLFGGRKRGPIYAVYALLEEDLGCRWYAGDGSRIPYRRTLRFRPVPRTYVPPLLIRDPFYKDAFDATWSLRNRANAPGAAVPEEWGGHVDYDGLFVHTFNQLVPPGTYFKDHPEYYSLIDGKRTPEQLCLTNPEVVKIASANVLRALKGNPDTEIAEVSANDNDQHCACPGCARLDRENGSPAGSLISFVNQVAAAVEKEHPGVWVSTLAYLHTVDAPTKVRPRRNVIVRLCNNLHAWRYPFSDFVTSDRPESKRYRAALIAWSKIADNLSIWDYTTNFSHYLAPMPNMHVLAPSARFYVAHNVKGIMFQGAYQSTGGESMPMRCWVMAKLLWDPSRDVDDLMRDFIGGYYEEAAAPIAAYYDLLERTRREHEEVIGCRYDMDSSFLTREFLDEATALFDQAETLAQSDEIRRRVQLARLPITYVKLSRGPQLTGVHGYRALIDEFETVARRDNITHLKEGPPDLDSKLQEWRDAARVAEELPQIAEDKVEVWPLPAVWKFATDADDVGTSEGWFAASLNDDKWAEVRSDQGNGWESQGFAHYTGFGWYRQALAIPAKLSRQHLYLYFGAVDEDAWVYINGGLALDHSCASTGLPPETIWVTPFAFDPRPHLQPGQINAIAVRVFNSLGMGGIYLPVYLVAADVPLDIALVKAVIERETRR